MGFHVEVPDQFGNAIVVDDDSISLRLANGDKRNIGTIDRASRILFVKRERAKHLFKANKSYGFNHKVMSEGKAFDRVHLTDDFGIYMIPREWILEHGRFLFFKQQGFERQLFIPVDMLTQFKYHGF